MHFIDDPSAAAVRPADPPAGTPGWFAPGNPATGQPGTRVRYSWLNMLQAELRAILAAANIQPAKGNDTQLLEALQALFLGGGAGGLFATVAQLQAEAAARAAGDAAEGAGRAEGDTYLLGAVDAARAYAAQLVGQEAVARDNTDTAINAFNTATYARLNQFGSNLAPSGFQRLPGGLIVQWGTGVTSGKLSAVPYPVAFPNAALMVMASEGAVAGWGDPPGPTIFGTAREANSFFRVSSVTLSGGGSLTAAFTSVTYTFFALGY